MPNRHYAFDCECDPELSTATARQCSHCGRNGRFVGWEMSLVERMCAFHRITGLPPYGPKRVSPERKRIVDRMVKCPACEGKGLIDVLDGESWARCRWCRGNGYALDGKFHRERSNARDSIWFFASFGLFYVLGRTFPVLIVFLLAIFGLAIVAISRVALNSRSR